jgi:hypothetical protein
VIRYGISGREATVIGSANRTSFASDELQPLRAELPKISPNLND